VITRAVVTPPAWTAKRYSTNFPLDEITADLALPL
jgi:hypothetical protein